MLLLDIPNGWKTAIMFLLMIAVFYLFLIRPQSQKTKKEAAYRDGLKNGMLLRALRMSDHSRLLFQRYLYAGQDPHAKGLQGKVF